jgi:hypothetical protein
METRYDSINSSGTALDQIEVLKQAAESLAQMLEKVPGRCASVALTHLQTAVMFGTRAIAEHYQDK